MDTRQILFVGVSIVIVIVVTILAGIIVIIVILVVIIARIVAVSSPGFRSVVRVYGQ